jgi:hypothetical protein
MKLTTGFGHSGFVFVSDFDLPAGADEMLFN